VPSYVDSFSIDIDNDKYFILVQEYIKGKNLKYLVQNGKYFSIEEVKNILRSILEILDYIHNLQPPIIHRDINPNNIIIGDDGKVYLVDFGDAGDIKKDTIFASNAFFLFLFFCLFLLLVLVYFYYYHFGLCLVSL